MNLIHCMNSIDESSLFSGLKTKLNKTKLKEVGAGGRASNVLLEKEF